MNIFLYNIDQITLSLPSLVCVAGGTASGMMQDNSYAPVRAVGWLGSRVAMIMSVGSGTPLIIYNLTKLVFVSLLDELTSKKVQVLHDYKKYNEMQLAAAVTYVTMLPLIILKLPFLIQSTRQYYPDIPKIWNELFQSDLSDMIQDNYRIYYKCLDKQIY